MTNTKSFVLIPGAWMGDWAWDLVVPELRVRGYPAYPLTLSGLEGDPDVSNIGLMTHVEDVLNILNDSNLHDVILVGHSYSGIVAGLVTDRMPERMAHTVYIAAFLPQNGRSLIDAFPQEQRDEERRQIAENRGRWPAPDAEGLANEPDLSPAQQQALVERLVAHPGRTVSEPASLDHPLSAQRATYISCALEQGDELPETVAGLRTEPNWNFCNLRAGHFPMISMPDQLAALLVEIAEQADTATP